MWFRLGAIVGAGGMLVAFPFLFPPAPSGESVAVVGDESLERTHVGVFRADVVGQDALHWGRGTLEVLKSSTGESQIQFLRDFEVGPGPNFWVYVNSTTGIDEESDFLADERRVRLAKLRSSRGRRSVACHWM